MVFVRSIVERHIGDESEHQTPGKLAVNEVLLIAWQTSSSYRECSHDTTSQWVFGILTLVESLSVLQGDGGVYFLLYAGGERRRKSQLF